MTPQTWIVVVVLTATVLLLAWAAFLAWRTTQVPFPGLFTEPTLIVNNLGDSTWPGYAAGFYFPDHLVALDGQSLESTTALMRVLAWYEPGDVVTLTAQGGDGALRDAHVRLEPLPINGLTSFFVLPYILGLIYLGIGTWVFLARRHEPAGRVFAMLCVMVALSLGLLFDVYTTHRLPRVWIAAISLVGSVAIHLALVFPQRVRFLDRAPSLRYLAYVPGAVIAIVNQFSLLNFGAPTAYFDTWYAAFALGIAGIAVVLAMMVYRHRCSQSLRWRISSQSTRKVPGIWQSKRVDMAVFIAWPHGSSAGQKARTARALAIRASLEGAAGAKEEAQQQPSAL